MPEKLSSTVWLLLHLGSGTWWSVTTIPSLWNSERYPLPRSHIHTTSSVLEFISSTVSSEIFFSNLTVCSLPSLSAVMSAIAPAEMPSASM